MPQQQQNPYQQQQQQFNPYQQQNPYGPPRQNPYQQQQPWQGGGSGMNWVNQQMGQQQFQPQQYQMASYPAASTPATAAATNDPNQAYQDAMTAHQANPSAESARAVNAAAAARGYLGNTDPSTVPRQYMDDMWGGSGWKQGGIVGLLRK